MENEWVVEYEPPKVRPPAKPQPLAKEPQALAQPLKPERSSTASRLGTRAAESVVGLPGDLLSGALGLSNYATGGIVPTYEKVQEKLPISFPTSEQKRKEIKEKTKGYYEPESGEDSFLDKVVSDFASFIVPTPFGKSKLLGSAVRAVGGNVSSEAAKAAGFGETGQAISKIVFNVGSMFPGSQRFFTKKYKQAYDLARDAIPQNATHNASKIESELTKLDRYVNSGDTATPAKKFLKERVNAVGSKINKDVIPVEEAWALNKDFNELLREENLNKNTKKLLGDLNKTLSETLHDYGEINPAFGKEFDVAQDLYKGIHQASQVNRFFQDNFQLKTFLKNKYVKGLFGLSGASLLGAPKTAGLAVTGASIGQGIKSFELIKNSKHARNIYKDILKSSLAGNVSAVTRDLRKLDKVADKWEQQNPHIDEGWVVES